ncbi:MAG: hypothetical protein R3324_03065 [Halobacteriales archaeon]|nr:hypothetical protein [Halobacteriales archaeon]
MLENVGTVGEGLRRQGRHEDGEPGDLALDAILVSDSTGPGEWMRMDGPLPTVHLGTRGRLPPSVPPPE